VPVRAGRPLAEGYVRVHADMTQVGPQVQRGLSGAVDRGARSVGRPLRDAILSPVKEGFAQGVRAADPGGAAVGGRFRQSLVGRLRGMARDTQAAGVDAGTGIDRGISAKMRDVAATTTRGGQQAGAGFARGIGTRARDAILTPVREGLAEGVRAADPGGAAVGGRLRQSLIGRLRGLAADTQAAGVDAGTGIDRGVGSKMRDVAATTARGGQEAGRAFSRSTGRGAEEEAPYLRRVGGSAAKSLFGAFAAERAGEVAIGGTIELFKGAVEGASDLSEAGNKLQVLFGPAAPKVQQWAAGAATALGQSTLQAEDAAATFGVFAESAGLAGDQSAQFSEQMVGLASDMASFSNTTPDQAIEAIGAALRGETEPIRAYGVLLDDATLRNRALKLGIVDTVKNALTPQQRVLAAQAEIMAQTGAAQGDFARTSGGLANQQRILAAQFTNAQAALGQQLLPLMLRAVTFLNTVALPAFTGLVGVLGAIPGPVYAVAAGLGALYAAIRAGQALRASQTFTDIGKAMQWMGLRTVEATAAEAAQATAAGGQAIANDAAAVSTTRLGTAMGTLAAAGLAAGGAFVATKLAGWANSAATASVSTNELATSVANLGTAGDVGFRKLFNRAGFGNLKVDAQSSAEALDQFQAAAAIAFGSNWTDRAQRIGSFGVASKQAEAQIRDLDASLASLATNGQADAAAASFTQLTARMRAAGVAEGDIAKAFPQYTAALAAAVSTTTAAGSATASLGDKQKQAALAAVQQKKDTDALTQSLQANNNAVLALRGGENALYAAESAVTAAVKANGRTLDVHTEKGRANRTALDALSSASLTYLGTIQKNNGVGPVFRRTLDQQWNKLYSAARRFGATRGEARKYADQILATPKALATRVTTPGLGAARAGVRGLAADIRNINGRQVTFRYDADGSVLITARSGSHVSSRRAFAGGGRIPGHSPSRTADDQAIWATAGEHMWSVDEVEGAGGHTGVERLRKLARTRQLATAVPGFAAGGPIILRNHGRLPIDPATTLMTNYAAGIIAKNAGTGAGGGGPIPGGSGVARWGPMVHRALAALGMSQGLWDNWMKQIATESGGNPRAVQGNIGDINNRTGDLAKGLLQTIGATFRAYHVPGTSNSVFDAWANMLAAMNYARHRYRGRMEAVIGHGHGYAAGTRRADPGWAVLAENGPELVRMRGGEQVETATSTRSILRGGPGTDLVRLHPDTVAQLAGVMAGAMARQPIVLDGRTLAGYVDRSMGQFSMSGRG
jgi:hypothetical protein